MEHSTIMFISIATFMLLAGFVLKCIDIAKNQNGETEGHGDEMIFWGFIIFIMLAFSQASQEDKKLSTPQSPPAITGTATP